MISYNRELHCQCSFADLAKSVNHSALLPTASPRLVGATARLSTR
jgi:hypothetical protein